ncbi:MAG: HEAT repeat domain-containing protein [Pirellulales bacterium]
MIGHRVAGKVQVGPVVALVFLAGCGGTPEPSAPDPETPAQPAAAQVAAPVERAQSPLAWRTSVPEPRPSTIRETAADALARIGAAAIPELVAALGDRDEDVRAEAARALARMGPTAKAAVPALIAALGDEHETVRRNAARALGQIGPAAEPAIPALIKAMKEPPKKTG